METFASEVIEEVSTTTVNFLVSFVDSYWATILSVLGVLLIIAIFRKLVKGGLRA